MLKNESFLRGDFNTNFIEKSKILQEIEEIKESEKTKVIKVSEIEEEEIAKLVFAIYQNLKEVSGKQTEKNGSSSNWIMAERMKMRSDNTFEQKK